MIRKEKDALIDRLLLLYAVERGNRYGNMDGPFKLMKIPLMAELESVEHGINTFNYTFYRYDHGPMTTEIYEDAHELRKLGLLDLPEKGQGPIRLTERGIGLLKNLAELYKQNEQICKYVDDSARTYAPLGFGALKKVIYARNVTIGGTTMKIADVPPFCDVISRIEGDNVIRFLLDDDWIDTLWGEFNYSDEQKAMARKIVVIAY